MASGSGAPAAREPAAVARLVAASAMDAASRNDGSRAACRHASKNAGVSGERGLVDVGPGMRRWITGQVRSRDDETDPYRGCRG